MMQVNFEKDIMLSDLNEYEILQILMGDCRDRLQAYPLSVEEEIKYYQVSVRRKAWSWSKLLVHLPEQVGPPGIMERSWTLSCS